MLPSFIDAHRRLVREGGMWDAYHGQWVPLQWPPGPPHAVAAWAEKIAKNMTDPCGRQCPLTNRFKDVWRLRGDVEAWGGFKNVAFIMAAVVFAGGSPQAVHQAFFHPIPSSYSDPPRAECPPQEWRGAAPSELAFAWSLN